MNFIITLIILFVILGILISIHEFGHFLVAKKRGIYVYEFCLGMGPKIFSFKRKNDETEYTLRLFAVGGYVSMANERGTNTKLKKNQILENKTFIEKIVVLLAGIVMNLILALLILFASGLIFGSPETKPVVGSVLKDYPAYVAGIKKNDLILSIDNKKISSWDEIVLELNVKNVKKNYLFEIQREDGTTEYTNVYPKKIKKDGDEKYVFGISVSTKKEYGVIPALEYTGTKFVSMINSIGDILEKLFTGKVAMNKLSGPVGMFSVIDNVKASGMESLLYLIAFLSVNVAIINLIPIPVFDGGRILLIIIEKIKGSKINPNIESFLNAFGFLLLILLMLFVTYNDILNLF